MTWQNIMALFVSKQMMVNFMCFITKLYVLVILYPIKG